MAVVPGTTSGHLQQPAQNWIIHAHAFVMTFHPLVPFRLRLWAVTTFVTQLQGTMDPSPMYTFLTIHCGTGKGVVRPAFFLCSFNNPPWFCKELPQPTTDNIEVRVCGDEGIIGDPNVYNEDTPVSLIELYAQ